MGTELAKFPPGGEWGRIENILGGLAGGVYSAPALNVFEITSIFRAGLRAEKGSIGATGGGKRVRPGMFSASAHRGGRHRKGRDGVPAAESPPLPDPQVPRCPYPDMLRSNPRCEAPGTTPNGLPASGRVVARGDMEG